MSKIKDYTIAVLPASSSSDNHDMYYITISIDIDILIF